MYLHCHAIHLSDANNRRVEKLPFRATCTQAQTNAFVTFNNIPGWRIKNGGRCLECGDIDICDREDADTVYWTEKSHTVCWTECHNAKTDQNMDLNQRLCQQPVKTTASRILSISTRFIYGPKTCGSFLFYTMSNLGLYVYALNLGKY